MRATLAITMLLALAPALLPGAAAAKKPKATPTPKPTPKAAPTPRPMSKPAPIAKQIEARPHDAPAGSFGLGIQIGTPTGVTAKLPLSRISSVDGLLGFGYEGFEIQADWLFELGIIGRAEEGNT